MNPLKTPGMLITFCGLDGCGKTTLIQKLEEYLRDLNIPVTLTKQPTDFVRQSAIFRSYMDTPAHDAYDYRSLSLLCASDRVQHSNRVIFPSLKKGDTVISDRYFYSCLANLHARGYTEDKWIYEVAESIPKPDLAFFLDIDVPTAVKRVRSREAEKNRFIDMGLQYRLKDEYIAIAKSNNGIIVPTDIGVENTFNIVKEHTADFIKNEMIGGERHYA